LPDRGLRHFIANSQLWKSIFRHGPPTNPRNRALAVISNFFLHLHPITMPKHGVRISYTWCLGGISFFLFLVETVTGVLLMFYYRPTVEYAYSDIMALRDQVSLGILREIHRWGAHAMVIAVMLHMLRVFMTGSYKPPREFNWVLGVTLLVSTLLLSFTGYLLPWDQLSMWAVTVGTNMAGAVPFAGHQAPFASALRIGDMELLTASNDVRYVLLGGTTVGAATLLRFYVLHCVAIPLVATVLMAVHFWRVRKDGGVSGPL
jgi:quinol-cytochrome oxidoreductase complex cytochrome b subunit